MHTTFAVTTEGLPLGILDQIIYAREPLPEEKIAIKKSTHNNGVPIEEKESIKWLNAVNQTQKLLKGKAVRAVTICDREADIYDFFEHANQIDADFLVRASQNRCINKKSLHTEKHKEKLWDFMKKQSSQGKIHVDVPAQKNNPARIAILDISFNSFTMNPSRNNIRNRNTKLDNLQMCHYLVKDSIHPCMESTR